MNHIVKLIYGVAILAILYFIVEMLYSVYYTPGVTTIYNSPQAQKIFPDATKKLHPTWGFNKAGMYDNQPFKFGQGQFWPESGKSFVPKKFGSPGASPSGGMRPTFSIPDETEIGWWSSSPDQQINNIRNIYDNSTQHVNYITPIGHWDN